MKKLVWLLTTIFLMAAVLMGCSAAGEVPAESEEEITLEVLPDEEAEEAEPAGEETSETEEPSSYEEGTGDDFFSEDDSYADYEDDASYEDEASYEETADEDDFSYEETDDVWGEEGDDITGGETYEGITVDEDGTYTSKEEVALYIHLYGKLPSNYITKKQAERLGWVASKGNLWDVAPGKSIGGSYFGNYEGILPDGDYRECDIDYQGGRRNAKRIVYSDDGSIYYTEDHYESFEQLY